MMLDAEPVWSMTFLARSSIENSPGLPRLIGPVTASVAGAAFAVRGAQLSNGALTMSGNQLAASAPGNIATSAITGGH